MSGDISSTVSVHEQRALGLPPPATLAVLYGSLIALGSALLKLPFSTAEDISWSDAIFTATSAVTVTGLTVVSTGDTYTFFGQFVIAVLIQLGGLGLMVFAVAVMISLGLSISIPGRIYLQQDLGQTSMTQIISLVRTVFRVTATLTLIGSAMFAIVFVPQHGWMDGLWQAVFHAVSATNNAGFALFENSFENYAGNALFNLTATALIVLGGLGFVVIFELQQKRVWRVLNLHTKLMLTGTAILLAAAFVLFAALEWSNPGTLGELPIGDKLLASWFQAVTPRTAGFNTVPIDQLEDETTLLTIVLMVIGAGPGSTAGGIKVTTFLAGVFATIAFLRQKEEVAVYGYALQRDQILKVMALVSVSVALILSMVFLLLIFEDQDFLSVLFEACSAFGTVGLSRGITEALSDPGRFIVCLLMFAGRVGPLAFGVFLATKAAARVRYPRGQIYLG